MENHPIPQDITGFQFKLIGNMTIKQFVYLAAGAILAWVMFAAPGPFILRFPFMFIFGALGPALAFLPIEGRPLDQMISHFIKAVLSPTQFIYHKDGIAFYSPPSPVLTPKKTEAEEKEEQPSEKLTAYLSTLPTRPKNKLDERETVFFQSLANFAVPTPQPQTQATLNPEVVAPYAFAKMTPTEPAQIPVAPQPIEEQKASVNKEDKAKEEKEEMQRHLMLQQLAEMSGRGKPKAEAQAQINQAQPGAVAQATEPETPEQIQKELSEAMKEEEAQKNTPNYAVAHQKVVQLENLLNETINQKKELEEQLAKLHEQLKAQKNANQNAPVAVKTEPKETTAHARMIPKNQAKSAGIPNAPEYPNVISGIVKDPRSNPLSGILIEVKDSEGNPVRAFKTNPLGQFASATPLINGSYIIDFEDPKGANKFESIQFTASGDIILPIEIISTDTREELRRALFN